jgi:hypothetical protein
MEYIEGTPLKGPMPFEEAIKYAARLNAALQAFFPTCTTKSTSKRGRTAWYGGALPFPRPGAVWYFRISPQAASR